jgi:site-specific DNA-methyltransferase (adenine-specific)
MTVTIYTGDCREVLRHLPDESVDAIVCDPPYEIGFMGKDWDKSGVAFDVRTWREALRLAKPGAYLLAFGGTRKVHRMACAIEDAGWEIRDRILWLYGSGFPKSHNLPDGRGTALKPAHEPIIMARKPLIGTVAANVLAYGTGALNIDACRVPADEELRAGAGGIPCRHDERVSRGRSGEASGERRYTSDGGTNFAMTPGPRGGDPAGRWPANVIHDGSDAIVSRFPIVASGAPSGIRAGGQGNAYGMFAGGIPVTGFGDSGSAARFFYCAKPSKAEREMGLEQAEKRLFGMSSAAAAAARGERYDNGDGGVNRVTERANNHPTVKPIDLMRYCCRLVTPPGGTVLDMFCGSGSTGCGAVAEGFDFIAAELDPHNVAIANARIAAVQPGLPLGATA